MNRSSSQDKLVILDRDGVINHDSDKYVKSVDEWVPIPGSLEAIARLNHAGYRILVATNQSGLARGLFSIEDLNAIHRRMHRELSVHGAQIEAIFFCPHAPNTNCRCRKPLPGLIEDISIRLQVDLNGVPLIGDALRDVEAAIAAGASPILVRTGKGKRTIADHGAKLASVPVYDNLRAAVDALLAA